MAIRRREAYIYKSTCSLAPAESNSVSLQVSSSWQFVATRISYVAETAVLNAVPQFEVQLLKNDYAIFADYVSNEVLSGMCINKNVSPWVKYQVGQALWFKLDEGFLFEPKENIILNVRETGNVGSSGVKSTTIKFYIAGYKEYR